MVDFSLTSVETGCVLSILAVVYIIGTLLTPFIPNWIEKRVTLISACFLMGLFNFLIGPSQIFGLPESLLLVVIGLATSGSCMAPMLIPAMPEMMAAAKEKFPTTN